MELSNNCRILGKLSMGYTEEQQANGLAAALAAGYTADEINSMFLPIWRYQITYFEEKQREYVGYDSELATMIKTGYNYILATGNGDPESGGYLGEGMKAWPVTPTVYGPPVQLTYAPQAVIADVVTNNNRVDKVVRPRLLFTAWKDVQGINSINVFISDYNAAQRIGDRGASNIIADIIAFGNSPNTRDGPNVAANGTINTKVNGSLWNHYHWHVGPSKGTIIRYTPCSIIAQQIITEVYGSKSSIENPQVPPNWGPQSVDPATQVDLIDMTSCVMGIEFWDFTHVDGSTKRVGAFVCPVPETVPESDPSVLTFLPDADLVCDYTPLEITLPDTEPFPSAPFPGIPWDGLLMPGRPAPIYPAYKGFLAYDTALKKWGKAKLEYIQLLDLSPINTNQGKIVTTSRFGMEAAAYTSDDKLYRFDANPSDSYIKYGKIGMYRLGYTTLEEVRVTFRLPVTGTITASTSLDGRNPEAGLTKIDAYTNATWYNMGVGASGKWHTITIKGNYDITHLEYVGFAQGRR